MAWLGTWAKRRKITITQNFIDSDLSHFPLPIFLGTSVGLEYDLSSNLALHYKLNDDEDNSTVTDSSDNNNTGTLTNDYNNYTSEQSAIGKINDCFDFNEDGYVESTSDSLADETVFSFSIWINRPNRGDARAIFSADDGTSTWCGTALDYGSKLGFKMNGVWWYAANDTEVCDNTWHLVSFTFDGTTLTCYIDGEERSSTTGFSGESWPSTSSSLFLASAGNTGWKCYGSLDDFRVYKRCLTATEILNVYNNGSGTEDTPTQSKADVSNIFDEVGSNWQKIAITKSDGTTQLYGEKELWDSTNEEALLWVSKSGWTISSSSDTEIYIYYDNSQSDNTSYITDVGNRTEVWDSDFKAVYHMSDASGGITDSTSNNNDGSELGSTVSYQNAGKIGYAVDLNRSNNDGFGVPDSNSLDLTTGWTLQAWFNLMSTGEYPSTLLSKGYDGSDVPYGLGVATNVSYAEVDFFDGSWRRDTESSASANTWHQLTGTYDGSTLIAYLDNVGTGTDYSATTVQNDKDLGIGRRYDWNGGSALGVDGLIEEIRISNKVRSEDWRTLDYYSQQDNILSYSSEETGDGGEAEEANAVFFGCNF